MKRVISAIVLLLLIPALFLNAFAVDGASEPDIINLEDGSYVCIEIISTDLRETGRKIGHKTYTRYNRNGEEDWSATLTGSFAYTGTSVTCTSSSCSVKITDTDWAVVSKSTDRIGNAATATLIMARSLLGVQIENAEVNINLTCDENGNLS